MILLPVQPTPDGRHLLGGEKKDQITTSGGIQFASATTTKRPRRGCLVVFFRNIREGGMSRKSSINFPPVLLVFPGRFSGSG